MSPETISSENLSKELAYLLGVYLTDGSFNGMKPTKNGTVHYNFQLGVIDKDFAEFTLECCKTLVPDSSATVRMYDYGPSGFAKTASPRYQFGIPFGIWRDYFVSQTGAKHHIPYVIWGASKEIQKWFIAGAMDGDGWISGMKRKDGSIEYRCGLGGLSDGWVWEFRDLLQKLGVRVRTPDMDFKGRPMVRLHFGIDTFLDSGLFFKMKRKSDRLEAARKELEDKRKEVLTCEYCGGSFGRPNNLRSQKFCSRKCRIGNLNQDRRKLRSVQRLKVTGLERPKYSPTPMATPGPAEGAGGIQP